MNRKWKGAADLQIVMVTLKQATAAEVALVLVNVGTLIFSGLGRLQDHKRDGGGYYASVRSAAEHKAADNVPERPPIDWNAIREGKDKYSELKWKGEGLEGFGNPQIMTSKSSCQPEPEVISMHD